MTLGYVYVLYVHSIVIIFPFISEFNFLPYGPDYNDSTDFITSYDQFDFFANPSDWSTPMIFYRNNYNTAYVSSIEVRVGKCSRGHSYSSAVIFLCD